MTINWVHWIECSLYTQEAYVYLGKPHADLLMKSAWCIVCSEGRGQGQSPGQTQGNDSFEEVGFPINVKDSADGQRHGGKALHRRGTEEEGAQDMFKKWESRFSQGQMIWQGNVQKFGSQSGGRPGMTGFFHLLWDPSIQLSVKKANVGHTDVMWAAKSHICYCAPWQS